MRLPPARAVLAGAVAAFALAGCNGGSYTVAENAQGTVSSFILDCSRGDAVAASGLLTEASRRRFDAHGPDVLDQCQSIIPFGLPKGTDPSVLHDAVVSRNRSITTDNIKTFVRFHGRTIPVLMEEVSYWRLVGNYPGLGIGGPLGVRSPPSR